jgi:hypothetical protein
MSARDQLTDFIVDLLHKAGVLDSLMDDEQTTPVHRKVDSLLGAASAESLAEGLSESERAFLTFALGLAADQMASRGDEFGDEDEAALTSLRRMAIGAESAEQAAVRRSVDAQFPVVAAFLAEGNAGDEGELERLRARVAELVDQHDDLAHALGRSIGTEWSDLISIAAGAVHAEETARKLRARTAERDELKSRLSAVLDLCDREQRGAMRWQDPLPVPEWVAVVQRAALGDAPKGGDPR